MINRRNLLCTAPMAVMAVPQIVQALPAPMPVVEAGPFPAHPGWEEHPTRMLGRIWRAWANEKAGIEGKILASEMKSRMEEVVKRVTGHRPPFLLRHHSGAFNEFIFHRVSDRAEASELSSWGSLDQPCYVIEWTPEFWRHTMGDTPRHGNTGMKEYMWLSLFREHEKVIYDL